MKPFCGYHYGDYFAHWLSFDRPGAKLPKIFHVNWFRKGADGKFLWPGFGDNLRVLQWMIDRAEGRARGVETPIGILPDAGELQLEGLQLERARLDELLDVDHAAWQAELSAIGDYLASFTPRLPERLQQEQQRVVQALQSDAGASRREAAAS
jgi:phosphoenolpyruvate carboxykinase (GTP)